MEVEAVTTGVVAATMAVEWAVVLVVEWAVTTDLPEWAPTRGGPVWTRALAMGPKEKISSMGRMTRERMTGELLRKAVLKTGSTHSGRRIHPG